MSDYRDDRVALRQRLEQLEEENAALREENRLLREPKPEPSAQQPAPSAELSPPPRDVPSALRVCTLLHFFDFGMLTVGTCLMLLPVGYAHVSHSPLWALAGLLVPLYKLRRNWRALALLRRGLAAPAKVVVADDTSSWSYGTNVGRALKGWGDLGEDYGGPYNKTIVRIGRAEGPWTERTLRGRPYEDGMFLFDPDDPEKNVGMWELPVAVRPDAKGRLPSSVSIGSWLGAIAGLVAYAGTLVLIASAFV